MSNTFPFCLGILTGFIVGAFMVGAAYDSKDANRIKIGFMSTSQGVYRLVEVQP